MGLVNLSGFDAKEIRYRPEEMDTLLFMAKQGDKVARDQFITANTRLVLSVISRYYRDKENSDDIFQVGCIGLIKALDNFDERFQVKFSTYAVPMIIGEIRRYLKDTNSLRIARSIRDNAYKVLKTRDELERAGCDSVRIEDISEKLDMPVKEVVCALDAVSGLVSLYEPVYNSGEDNLMLMDQIGDEKNNDELWAENVSLRSAVEELDERERRIIYLRYYSGKTQVEISESVGISQAQVSRLEKNAINKIRRAM